MDTFIFDSRTEGARRCCARLQPLYTEYVWSRCFTSGYLLFAAAAAEIPRIGFNVCLPSARRSACSLEQFAMNVRNTLNVDLWPAIVSKQSIHFLFDIRKLRVTEARQELQTGNAEH